jgi:uncharacterized membrane protein
MPTITPERIAETDGQRVIEFYLILLGILDMFCKDRKRDYAEQNNTGRGGEEQ